MTVGEIKNAVMFQTNNDTDDVGDFLPYLMDYINEGYLYFCSKDPSSGELQFSRTLEEHEAAVAQYRPLWEAYDAEQRAKAAETPQPTEGTNP